METNRLRQFKVVYELRNLRGAAEVVGLSHSALSKSLKVLQSELNTVLLVQDGRGIDVTEAGHKFYVKLQEFLCAEDLLLTKEAPRVAPFRIGTFEVFSTHLLGFQWSRYFPETTLELHELLPGALEKAIIGNHVDIGLTYEPIATAGLEFRAIGKVKMRLFCREGAFSKLAVSELPFVAPIAPVFGTPSGTKGLDGWPDHEIPRRIKHRVDMMESGLALARAGVAVMFLPTFVAHHHNAVVKEQFKLVERPLPKNMRPIERKIFLVKKRSYEDSSLLTRLGKLLREQCF
jgi:DNA-binding transcriptional LysR family regulator